MAKNNSGFAEQNKATRFPDSASNIRCTILYIDFAKNAATSAKMSQTGCMETGVMSIV